MFVDIWGWFNRYEAEAIQKGDTIRQRLVQVAREGWDYRKLADGENAIRCFEEGARIARMLNEPCWIIFYEHWISVIRLFTLADVQGTLDRAVRLATEVRKDIYKDCHVKSRVIYLLAKVYYLLDFRAYERDMLNLMDYLEHEVGMDEDTYLQTLSKRAEIEISYERYDKAIERLQDLIHRGSHNDFRMVDAYSLLRRIAFSQGELDSALQYSLTASKHAAAAQIQQSIVEEILWETVILKYLGQDSHARERYYVALARVEHYKLPLEGAYAYPNTEYLELDGQFEAALKAHENFLALILAKPSVTNQIEAYRSYIGFLARNKQDFTEALSRAKAIANSSPKPEYYLEKLGQIEAGKYFEFEWQKTSRKKR